MIQLSSLLPAIPHGPVRPAVLDPAGVSSFALALSALVLPPAGLPQPEGEADPLLPSRQPLAEPGKDLPDGLLEGDAEPNSQPEDPDAEDVAFAWFAIPLPTDTALPTPVEPSMLPLPAAAPVADTVVPMADPVQPYVGPVLSKAEAVPPAASAAPESSGIATTGAPVPEAAPAETAAPRLPVDGAIREAPRARAAVPIAAAVLPADDAPPAPHIEAPTRNADALASPQPAPQQVQAERSARFQPPNAPIAPPPLAAAIEAAALSAPAVSAPSRRAPAIEPAVIALAPSAADAMRPHAVVAADVQQGMIDMRRQEWMGQMVEQIEAMRDAAPVRETRLSLAPEALGKVDVSIRQEGDRVHVHFATETQAARQLIADAQPRLNELAEARGLKLGQTSFDSTTAGQGGRDGREQFAQPQSRTPRPAASETSVGTPDDDRIA